MPVEHLQVYVLAHEPGRDDDLLVERDVRLAILLEIADNLLAGGPTLIFSPDGNQIVVGGFSVKGGSGDNAIYVIKLK